MIYLRNSLFRKGEDSAIVFIIRSFFCVSEVNGFSSTSVNVIGNEIALIAIFLLV